MKDHIPEWTSANVVHVSDEERNIIGDDSFQRKISPWYIITNFGVKKFIFIMITFIFTCLGLFFNNSDYLKNLPEFNTNFDIFWIFRSIFYLYTTSIIFFMSYIYMSISILQFSSKKSFTDPDDLAQMFSIPVYGAIPIHTKATPQSIAEYVQRRNSSSLAESIRMLRTSLMMSGRNTNAKTIMITSSVHGEGKTTGAVLLSLSFSAIGKRVLLIECDLRRSIFTSYFGRPRGSGLISLIQDNELQQQFWNDPKPWRKDSIVVIQAGKLNKANPGDVLSSPRFEDFLSESREIYDTPPVLPVPDARLIARHCDTVLYSVRAGETKAKEISNGLRLFSNSNIKVNGLCLTQIKRHWLTRDFPSFGPSRVHYFDN